MRITKLLKESNLDDDTAKIIVEITVPRQKDYTGFDVFPDQLIPDLLLAMSRRYKFVEGKLIEKGLLPNVSKEGRI